ncbi:MAG TPA: pitrilysin family protein [Ktedonobacterales bacterium]|jgi:predicted Zn-dependent peptidase
MTVTGTPGQTGKNLQSSGNRSQFYKHQLSNGLQILGERMPDFESVAVAFHVRTGARDEPDQRVFGVSHFLEHMVFKGTPKRSAEEISLAFNNIGAEFNAFTSLEQTFYYARVLGENLAPAVELLADMMRPRLDKDEFNTERGVIIEEIARSEEVPARQAYRWLMRHYFDSHPLGREVLGSRESISEMDVEWMREYWQQRYSANNLILAVAGNFQWEQVVELAERYCSSWPHGEAGRKLAPYTPAKAVTAVCQKEKLQQEQILLAFPSLGQEDPDYYAMDLACLVLGDGSGSRLFWNIHQKGLAEAAVAGLMSFEGTGLVELYATTNPTDAPEVLRLMLDELKKLEAHGVEEDELRRAKDKLISRIVLQAEHTSSRMQSLPASWISEGKLKSTEEEVADVEAVTVEKVRQTLARFPISEKLVVTAYGPLDAQALGLS